MNTSRKEWSIIVFSIGVLYVIGCTDSGGVHGLVFAGTTASGGTTGQSGAGGSAAANNTTVTAADTGSDVDSIESDGGDPAFAGSTITGGAGNRTASNAGSKGSAGKSGSNGKAGSQGAAGVAGSANTAGATGSAGAAGTTVVEDPNKCPSGFNCIEPLAGIGYRCVNASTNMAPECTNDVNICATALHASTCGDPSFGMRFCERKCTP